MSTVAMSEPRIQEIQITDDSIVANLVDGRTIRVPLAWSWRLSEATVEQRARYEIIGDGQGIHWPEINENLSAQGMLTGGPAPRPQQHA